MPQLAKAVPKSSIGAFDVFVFLTLSCFVKMVQNGHGALVGLTKAKIQVWRNSFNFEKEERNMRFLSLVALIP